MNETTNRIEQAAVRREEAESKLLRPDGSRLYGDAEHQERLSAIRREHAEAFDAIETGIERVIERHREELLGLEHSGYADSLSGSELAEAAARKVYVADEVSVMPLPALARRLEAVLVGGDRASMFNHSHHAALRVGEEPSVGPDTAGLYHRPDDGASEAAEEEGSEEVRGLVAALRAKLDPSREEKIARTRQELEEAEQMHLTAQYRRRGVGGAADLHARQSYAIYQR